MIFKKAAPLAELLKPAPVNKITKLQIHYNCGFGNFLTIRGQGAGLTWDSGTTLKNIRDDLWSFEPVLPFTQIEFKILLNDQVYETGENNLLKTGQNLDHTPRFE